MPVIMLLSVTKISPITQCAEESFRMIRLWMVSELDKGGCGDPLADDQHFVDDRGIGPDPGRTRIRLLLSSEITSMSDSASPR